MRRAATGTGFDPRAGGGGGAAVLVAAAAIAAIALLVEAGLRRGGAAATLAGVGLAIAHPGWLRLLAAAPLYALAQRRSLAGLGRARRGALLGARVLLHVLLVVALAAPSRSERRRDVATVALVDVSASVSDEQLREAREYVEALRAAAAPGALSLVTFAARPRRMELPPTGRPLPPFARPTSAAGARGDESHLQAALRLAYGLLPDGAIPRVVLLSDGNQTRGDLLDEAGEAARRGIRLDVHPYAASGGDELIARALELPDEARAGEPFRMHARVYASRTVDAELRVVRRGAPAAPAPRRIRLEAGESRVAIDARVDEPGPATFEVRVAALDASFRDRRPENDLAAGALRVVGEPRVLFVEGDARAATPLADRLRRERVAVDVRGPAAAPATSRDLLRYDLVVLSDVAASALGTERMEALASYARDQGGGILFAGGENVFGEGGYAGAPLEAVLPVRFAAAERHARSQLALVLAIDRSGSMQGDKLELAKDAARASVEILAPTDLVSVVAFDAIAQPVVNLARAGARAAILDGIARLRAGGGTNVLPPLQEAFDELSTSAAARRHVILLTDGQASYEGVAELCDEMARAGVTVSAVGVGDGADKTLLSLIARRGGGRFYFTDDPRDVPQIFIRDTEAQARPALVEEPTRLRALKPAEVLAGVDVAALPPLTGLVATRPEAGAEVLLVSARGEPVLARWRVGLGQVAAWTSDVKNRWAAALVASDGGARLLTQLARATMRAQAEAAPAPGSDGRASARASLGAEITDDTLRITAEVRDRDEAFLTGLDGDVEVQGPGAATTGGTRVRRARLVETAPGLYQAELPFDGHGACLLRSTHRDPATGARVATGTASVSLPWSREHLALPPDLDLLRRAAARTGGRVGPAATEVVEPGADSVEARRDLRRPLLLLAALLLVVDVLLRRLRGARAVVGQPLVD